MSEEIRIKDPDGSENASTASVTQAQQPSVDSTMRALSSAQSERLSLQQLEAREARYGRRKPQGPLLTENSEETTRAVTAEDEVEAVEPMELEEG